MWQGGPLNPFPLCWPENPLVSITNLPETNNIRFFDILYSHFKMGITLKRVEGLTHFEMIENKPQALVATLVIKFLVKVQMKLQLSDQATSRTAQSNPSSCTQLQHFCSTDH